MRMLGSVTVTVLVPLQLQGEEDGYLCGSCTTSQADALNERVDHVMIITTRQPQSTDHFGCINNTPKAELQRSTLTWIELRTVPDIAIRSIRIDGKCVCRSQVNLVLYDTEEICESELISKKFRYKENGNNGSDIVPYFVYCVRRDCGRRQFSSMETVLLDFIMIITKLILYMMWLPKATLQLFHSFFFDKLGYSSSAVNQFQLRIAQIEKLNEELKLRKKTLVCGRLAVMIGIDVLIGVLVAFLISSHATVNDVYDIFCTGAKGLATSVMHLLEWLSGAPAGLKLNQPLTQALSAFFSYHVHLWMLYLELADPVLRGLARVLVWLGMCGASIQVAILSDLLDVATLHLYCFYVYAARIHMLQISLLGSQWRAFRGRKWNPLKQRVDSYEIGGQMSLTRVLTAVVFTLVIFLLPTTTIYYLVFIVMRLGLNTLRGILDFTTWCINVNPLYIVFMNVINNNTVKGDVYFATLPAARKCDNTGTAPLKLRLHTWPTPLTEVLTYIYCEVFPQRPSLQWSSICRSILFGHDLL